MNDYSGTLSGIVNNVNNRSKPDVKENLIDTTNIGVKHKTRQTCRLCTGVGYDYSPIFGSDNTSLAEKISRCLPIIVLSTDELPLYVCKQCVLLLNASYKLILRSLKAEALLQSQLTQTNEEKSPIESNIRDHDDPVIITINSEEILKQYADVSNQNLKYFLHCDLCKKTFHDMDAFDSHVETSHLLQWRCNLCDSSFETSEELTSHELLKHDNKTMIVDLAHLQPESSSRSSTGAETTIVRESIQGHVSNDIENQEDSRERRSTIANDLTCNICNIVVENAKQLTKHSIVHSPKSRTCNTCQQQCSSLYELFLHKRNTHNMYKRLNLRYVCDTCEKFFSSISKCERHVNMTCSQKFKRYSCKYCTVTLTTKIKLTQHLRKHKEDMLSDPMATLYKCVGCPKVFVDEKFYQKHRNVHDPECWDKFKCNLCDRHFRDGPRLKEHLESIHEGLKPHRCDICERAFHRLSNMKTHREKHFAQKCSYCEEAFQTARMLAHHMNSVHKVPADFKIQLRKTRGAGCYVCRFCGKKLSTSQSLLDHEHIHTGEQPYSCKLCAKTFRSYTAKWAHEQRHKKESYVCEHCGKCFSHKQNLTTHLQVHVPVENRKHPCPRCGKRFLRSAHLKVHMRIHDGLRPYSCDICLFTFTQLGDMRRHRAKHAFGEIRMRKPRNRVFNNFNNEVSIPVSQQNKVDVQLIE